MNKNSNKITSYVFTINAVDHKKITKRNLSRLRDLINEPWCNFIVWSIEFGKNKTKHIQGYFQLIGFDTRRNFKKIYELFNLKYRGKLVKFYLKDAMAGYEYNVCYSLKDYYDRDKKLALDLIGMGLNEPNYFMAGTPVSSRERTDNTLIATAAAGGMSPSQALKDGIIKNKGHYNWFKTVQAIKTTPNRFRRHGLFLWGSTGSGKTTAVYDLFGLDQVEVIQDKNYHVSDRYFNQKCLLLDDFRINDFPVNFLLKLGHEFPMWLSAKYSHSKPLNSDFVVITSPRPLYQVFPGCFRYNSNTNAREYYPCDGTCSYSQVSRRFRTININYKNNIGLDHLKNFIDVHNRACEANCDAGGMSVCLKPVNDGPGALKWVLND